MEILQGVIRNPCDNFMALDYQGVLDSGLNILIMLLSVVIGGGGVWGGIWLYFKWKKYKEYKCVIWGRDSSGNLNESYDRAGVFVDSKTQNKRLFLKKNNVGLDPDNIPYINAGGNKIIYLLQKGLKNFHYIKIKVVDTNVTLNVGEEDVNWAINAYDRQKKLFNQNLFMQYLPFIALAFVSMIILIIFIYFFKDFAVLKDVAIALRDASIAQHGTVVS